MMSAVRFLLLAFLAINVFAAEDNLEASGSGDVGNTAKKFPFGSGAWPDVVRGGDGGIVIDRAHFREKREYEDDSLLTDIANPELADKVLPDPYKSTKFGSRKERKQWQSSGLGEYFHAENPDCRGNSVCQDDSDCSGGTCVGSNLLTCDCLACDNHDHDWCETDEDCGGVPNACDFQVGKCDCLTAYVKNGFNGGRDALKYVCDKAQCDSSLDYCFGMPCNTGRCKC